MFHLPLLSTMIWLPIIGAVIILLCAHKDHAATSARVIALITAVLVLLCCIPLWMHFDRHTAAMQFVEYHSWIPVYHINYYLGADGIAMPLVLLTCFTTLIVILASWRMIHEKVAQYLAAFLVMQVMVIGVFCACDAILFYVFWEAMLIPMYLSIGIWGGARRSYAAIKFFPLYLFWFSFAIGGIDILWLRSWHLYHC